MAQWPLFKFRRYPFAFYISEANIGIENSSAIPGASPFFSVVKQSTKVTARGLPIQRRSDGHHHSKMHSSIPHCAYTRDRKIFERDFERISTLPISPQLYPTPLAISFILSCAEVSCCLSGLWCEKKTKGKLEIIIRSFRMYNCTIIRGRE